MAGNELAAKLERRNRLIEETERLAALEEAAAAGGDGRSADRDGTSAVSTTTTTMTWPSTRVWNAYSEFKELTRKQIQYYQKMFTK